MISEIAKQIAETKISSASSVESGPGKFEVPGTRDLGRTDDGPTGFDAKDIGNLSDIEANMTPGRRDTEPGKDAFTRNKADVGTSGTEVRAKDTINMKLEGQNYPGTDVLFERVRTETDKGEQVEVVVPKFESVEDVQLPEELEKETDFKQNKECNGQLKEDVENKPELAERFNDEQLDQIKNGETPEGYTWHHDAPKGKMQLIDLKIHAKVRHTGGKEIWGGGSEHR
jgi:hypothetical protein